MPLCGNNIKAVCVSNGIRVKAEEQKEFAMAEDKKPNCGDLIEIPRGLYQHWAIYVGDGYVVHLASASEHANAGASSVKSVVHNKATVKREKLEDVVGNDTYYINNHLDEKYEPHPIQDILQDAKILVDKELQYGVTTKNCEHFVTLLRYGQPHSQQVEDAAVYGSLIAGIVVLGYVIFKLATSKDKEKEKNEHGNGK
ncbi:phospholipase A and acyltransferase 3-like [Ctenopharyngodon idella]|uniref:phospholipase A and acyltransferase 3-like n=1 Tax=Ctenopharyngodon idella TaxID=7959 RepID=UPI002232C4E2|nr:phospholipase A and acyltransferase 3-like [Ctenopharyngodon idella]